MRTSFDRLLWNRVVYLHNNVCYELVHNADRTPAATACYPHIHSVFDVAGWYGRLCVVVVVGFADNGHPSGQSSAE